MQSAILKSIGLGFICLGLTLTAFAQGNGKKEENNLAANGNFEEWSPYTPAKGNPSGAESPAKWNPYVEAPAPDSETKGSISKDTNVKHGGEASLRIENGLPTDTTGVYQMFSVEPNTTYRLRFWIKGEEIAPNPKNGLGVALWASWGPKDFWGHQTSTMKTPDIKKGTFDWQEVTFDVDTGEDAAFMKIDVQLRRASGKLWGDDVEVIPMSEIKRTKSY